MKISKRGLAPGSVVHTGERFLEAPMLTRIVYSADKVTESAPDEAQLEPCEAAETAWLNVIGLHDTELLTRLGEIYSLHPLTLEDIASTQQRPKFEGYDSYLYVVLRMLRLDGDTLDNEQISLVLTGNEVLLFEERPGDVFDAVRERLRRKKGHVREHGAAYLSYALLDAVVDSYFTVLEYYSDLVETLEEQVLRDPGPATLEVVNQTRRELLTVRKAVWPLRELVAALLREDTPLLGESVSAYLRDVYDHAVQVIDTVETLRELLSGLHDIYLSGLSYKMNEVMKVLTIIATIFIPLSFIVGLYGMNFVNIPELHYRNGYFVLWAVMILVVGGMLAYFKRRGWL